MPIYEYTCNECLEIFSLLQWASSGTEDTVCPRCGSKDVKKKLSSFSCSMPSDSGVSSGGHSGFSGGG